MQFKFQNKVDNKAGHYLVSNMNSWHSGIHVVGDVKAIADGEVIAYKISSKYYEIKKTKDNQEIVKYYSDGFVLIRHTYQYRVMEEGGKEKTKEFIFYSLYLHLVIKEEMLAKDNFPDFFRCQQKIESHEKLNTKLSCNAGIHLRDHQKKVLGIIPKGCKIVVFPQGMENHWYKVVLPKIIRYNKYSAEVVNGKFEGYYYNNVLSSKYEIYRPGSEYNYSKHTMGLRFSELNKFYFVDKVKCMGNDGWPSYHEMLCLEVSADEDCVKMVDGAILRSEANAHSTVIGIISNGDMVRILEKGSNDWFKVKVPEIYILKENTAVKVIYAKQSRKGGYIGWCRNINGQFDGYIQPEYDKIVQFDKPVKVRAGEIIGFSGKNESMGGQILNNYVASHLEVFSNDDVPSFLSDMKKLVKDDNRLYEQIVAKEDFKGKSFTHINRKEYKKIEKVNVESNNKTKQERISPSKLSLSSEGKAFIKAWEGEKLTGYLDSKNILTIGVGCVILDNKVNKSIVLKNANEINSPETIKRVSQDYVKKENGRDVIKITKEQSDELYNIKIKIFENAVRKLNVDMYQWEFDAMVSLFFNAGEYVKAPALRRNLINKKYTDAGKQFNDITSHDEEGLVYRRAAEMDMFLNGGTDGYVYFKNDNKVRRDELVDKLNDIRKELGVATYKK